MYDVLSALLLRCFLRCFCVYSLAVSGERRNPRRTGHFGVRGIRTRGLSWPSMAKYRMMKLKKKKKGKGVAGARLIRGSPGMRLRTSGPSWPLANRTTTGWNG